MSRDDGLELTDCYVAAAARCAPPENKPTVQEFANCRPYLEAEIRLLNRVRVVVALGRAALENFLKASDYRDRTGARPAARFAHGGETALPDGRTLLCSFHPSRRNTNTGLLTRPMWHGIFRRARELVGSAEARSRRSRSRVTAVE